MRVRVGLPYLPGESGHPFLATLISLGAAPLLSVGSLFRPGRGFSRVSLQAWNHRPALDSAGFVATARFGGYRWSVEKYVDQVVTNFGHAEMPFPWAWWSAMDYCCEAEIAPDRAEVARRMAATVDGYVETMAFLNGWRDEGENTTPDPLPILQGRTPRDYVEMARALGEAVDSCERCTCPTGQVEDCSAEWHRQHRGLPPLVGLGSVCRRPIGGPEGILSVLGALDAALPAHVKLHLFGVKGALLSTPAMGDFAHRIESVDSAAWDFAARRQANTRRTAGEVVSVTVADRAAMMAVWYRAQKPARPKQASLFGR